MEPIEFAIITVIAIIGYFLCGLAGIPYFNSTLRNNGIIPSVNVNNAGYALIIIFSVIFWPFWLIYSIIDFYRND